MKKIIKIANLDCAGCAAELEEELEKIEGAKASVDFVGQKVSLEYDGAETLEKCIDTISHFEEVVIVEEGGKRGKESRLKELLSIAVSVCLFIPALVISLVKGDEYPWNWVSFAVYLGAFAAAGWQVVWSAMKNFVKTFDKGFHPSRLLDENFLMLIAAVGAFALGENMEGAIVVILYEIGELLQSIAVGSSRGEIKKLLALKSKTAILVGEDGEKEVDAESLKAGDVVLLRKGDLVPADCRVVDGETSLDTKSLTGEAYLREVKTGDEVLAGCVNEGRAVKLEVLRPSEESAVAKILNLVENSTAKKAKSEKFITRFARIYTPVVVLIALIVAVLPPLVVDMGSGAVWGEWIMRALNLLVISCPCALIISVPLTYFAGVGTLAKCGVLAKGSVYLDMLAKADVAGFDKTGTLTEGKFAVVSCTSERALGLAAAVEKNSSHPLAQAFAGIPAPQRAERAEEMSGMGLSALVDGKRVLVGSARLMRENGVEIEEREGTVLTVYVAEEGVLVGEIGIDDRLREEAPSALEGLKQAGIRRIAVLTGDKKARAEAALRSLAVDEVHAELLPEDKIACARKLKENGVFLYVGDGINDTPVLAESDIAVSMGSLGSDAAIEASDLVLAGNLNSLPKAVRGAKKTRKIVTENIVFSIAAKVALMVLSVIPAVGLPLWAAVLGDVGVMLVAVINSLRMRAKIK